MILLRCTIVLCCIAIIALLPDAQARPPEKLKKLLDKASGPITLKLVAADLDAATAEVVVGGVTREVSARMFVFHDDRNRHFIAVKSECTGVEGSETIRCLLELPKFYLGKGRITGFTVHVHKREYEADPKVVEEKLNRAATSTTTTTTTTEVEGHGVDGGAVDGGGGGVNGGGQDAGHQRDAGRSRRD